MSADVIPSEFEQVVFFRDPASGLRTIIAIHSTALGPSLGGVRFRPYPSEADALDDVLRLAKGMTYKSSVAGLHLGGGKAVIMGDPRAGDREAVLRAFGQVVESLGGRYITAEDVGTTQADMDVIRDETWHVTGVSPSFGGSGDPSPPTAAGVFAAMRAVSRFLWGTDELAGRHVAVQGVGKVGRVLVGHLLDSGCTVTIADVDEAAVAALAGDDRVAVAPVEKVHAVDCDIFSPCALGGALSRERIPELSCAAVVGSANNQLADDGCADLLAKAGILYAPDYVVNAGGVINVAQELRGYKEEQAMAAVQGIYGTTLHVLGTAADEGVTPVVAAARIAEARIAAARAN